MPLAGGPETARLRTGAQPRWPPPPPRTVTARTWRAGSHRLPHPSVARRPRGSGCRSRPASPLRAPPRRPRSGRRRPVATARIGARIAGHDGVREVLGPALAGGRRRGRRRRARAAPRPAWRRRARCGVVSTGGPMIPIPSRASTTIGASGAPRPQPARCDARTISSGRFLRTSSVLAASTTPPGDRAPAHAHRNGPARAHSPTRSLRRRGRAARAACRSRSWASATARPSGRAPRGTARVHAGRFGAVPTRPSTRPPTATTGPRTANRRL